MCRYERGSEWRKWDLHIHTTSSGDTDYKNNDYNDLLVSAWKANELAAVAITDHFTIDADNIQSLRDMAPGITIFPGVELRTDKGGSNIHVILIFSDDCDLKTLSDDFNAMMIRDKAKNEGDFAKIYWNFEDIIEFSNKKDAIVSLHAGSKSEGIEKITNALEVSQAIKEEYAQYTHIFEVGKMKDIEEYKSIVFPSIRMEKPLIICSDNHDPRHYEIKEYLWLKANPTFNGLKQVINHPSERVFVGNVPPKLDQASKNPERYISSVKVQKKLTARNNEKWFDFDIPLNIGLVSVIGNKGSGKSAFSDIIAHACSSQNMSKASFLSGKRFRSKQRNYAGDYESEISWRNGTRVSTDTLQDDIPGVELVKFLPQSYIEEVCNELDNSFQREIDNVIFSYINVPERGPSESLEQLITAKTAVVNNKINELESQLAALNAEIVACEYKSVPSYKRSLEDLLEKQKNDYVILCSTPPLAVSKPTDELDADKDEAIQHAVEFIDSISNEIRNQQERIIHLDGEIAILQGIIDDIDDIENSVLNIKERIDSLSEANEELKSLSIKFTVDKTILIYLLSHRKEERDELSNNTSEFIGDIPMIDEQNIEASYNTLLDSSCSLDYKIKLTETYKSMLIDETTLAQRQYQKYLDDIKLWEIKKESLMGNEQEKDTIMYLQKELAYISKDMIVELNDKKSERRLLIGKIYDCYIEKVSVYNDIYQPIKDKIGNLLSGIDDEVNFTAGISCKNTIGSDINTWINKSIKSQLYRADGDRRLNDTIDSTDFSMKESVLLFTDAIFNCITVDTDVDKIIKGDRIEFSNFISCLSYLSVDFSLTMGGLALEEMSPGQRGTVLLIFYLALDKDEAPLIIDQPEDNLDNQSVFNKLVPCILAAKKTRQIIIVTHNPNIAIACDAEQIISCSIDKQTREITYTSGAIEETIVKDNVVRVLEGTQPAFNLRKRKYDFSH